MNISSVSISSHFCCLIKSDSRFNGHVIVIVDLTIFTWWAKISNSLDSLIMFVPLCSPLACNQVSWVTLNILWYLIILVKPKYHVENHQRTIHLSQRILIWKHSLSIKHATSYNITASQHASYTKCCMIHTKHCKVYTTVACDKHSIFNLSIFFLHKFS